MLSSTHSSRARIPGLNTPKDHAMMPHHERSSNPASCAGKREKISSSREGAIHPSEILSPASRTAGRERIPPQVQFRHCPTWPSAL